MSGDKKDDWREFELVGSVPILSKENPDQYVERREKVNEERLEKLANSFAAGLARTPTQIVALAKAVGASPESVRYWKLHPGMAKRVAERLQTRAIHLTAEILEKQAKLAEKSTAAAKFVASVGDVAASGASVKVQVNTAIDNRRGDEAESAVAFIDRFRTAQKTGLLKRLEVIEGGSEAREVPSG